MPALKFDHKLIKTRYCKNEKCNGGNPRQIIRRPDEKRWAYLQRKTCCPECGKALLSQLRRAKTLNCEQEQERRKVEDRLRRIKEAAERKARDIADLSAMIGRCTADLEHTSPVRTLSREEIEAISHTITPVDVIRDRCDKKVCYEPRYGF
jgi:hypothetical protein